MRLRLSLVRCDRADPAVDVEVTCATGTSLQEVRASLLHAVGAEDLPISVRGRVLDGSHTVGEPPLLDGAVLVFGPPGTPPPTSSPLLLAVTGGPDAGQQHDLRPGTVRIGRGAADVAIDDPSLSRGHAELVAGPDGIHVRDCGSTNGTRLDGRPVGTDGAAIDSGMVLTLGATRLQVRAAGARPAATRPTHEGTITVNRSPRIPTALPEATVTYPRRPERAGRARVPWLAMLLPVPVCGVLALLYGPQLLAFALMSPLLMAGNALSDRFSGRRSYAGRLREFERGRREAVRCRDAALAAERRHRLRSAPDLAEVLTIAVTPSARLWERRAEDDDWLLVRLGTATTASAVTVVDEDGGRGRPPIAEVPCVVSLAQAGPLGVAGSRRSRVGLARSLLGQLSALHSPLDLGVRVLCADEDSVHWRFVERLPHAGRGGVADPAVAVGAEPGGPCDNALARLNALVAQRKALEPRTNATSAAPRWPGPWTVVLLDGAEALRPLPGLATLLEEGPAVGVVAIALDADAARLPTEVRATVELADDPALARLDSASGGPWSSLVPDLAGAPWAERLSRALAPLRDATPEHQAGVIPQECRLVDVLEVDALDPRAVASTWERRPSATSAVMGMSSRGRHVVDLVADGPHILVAGTTGSGKSELLQTLITSLAVANRPDRLAFVLVDYKGGAAFQQCSALPHTTGVVTDLDPHLSERALSSLTAELKRRERLLGDVGAADFDAYAHHPRRESLPRLVIVVDEFRMLAEELPAFLEGVVRVAVVGRSLGVHVVLATQRPAGVVSADITANVNLRVALRLRDRSDSDDVIDAPDAASISERTPGRAVARAGSGGPLVTFQAARVGGRAREDSGAPVVRLLPWPPDRRSGLVAAGPPGGETDLTRLVSVLRRAAKLARTPPSRPPWLPPLPDLVHRVPAELPCLGLADHPDEQAQRLLCWDLADPGHWAVVGASGSGRSSVLRLAAAEIARAHTVASAHLYAVESGSALRGLAVLPHVGAVVPADDLGRLGRLVRRLEREVRERQVRLASQGYSSLAQWHELADGPAGVEQVGDVAPVPPPWIVLLIDGWERLVDASDGYDHGSLTDRLLALLRDGEAVGLRAMVSGGRGLLFGRPAAVLVHRALLRLADPTDVALAGIRPSAVPLHQPPGRAVLAPHGTEVQFAMLDPGDLRSGQDDPRAGPGGAAWPGGGPARLGASPPDGGGTSAASPARLPFKVDPLPERVDWADMVRHLTPAGTATLPLGIGGDEPGPVVLDPDRDGRQLLVVGPPRSGRSTVLRSLAAGLSRVGWPFAVVTARRGPLDELGDLPVVACAPEDGSALLEARRAFPSLAVLVDDADLLNDTPIDPLLREVTRRVEHDRGLLACATSTSALALQFRGVAVEVGRARTGILLGPAQPSDGEAFGLRSARVSERVPGRGLWVSGGDAVELQVVCPPPAGSPAQGVSQSLLGAP